MTCVPLQRDKPRVRESVKLAEFLLLTTICAKLAFLKPTYAHPVPLPAIFPHKPTTTTDCYIDMIFFTEQFKVQSDESKNIFCTPF